MCLFEVTHLISKEYQVLPETVPLLYWQSYQEEIKTWWMKNINSLYLLKEIEETQPYKMTVQYLYECKVCDRHTQKQKKKTPNSGSCMREKPLLSLTSSAECENKS